MRAILLTILAVIPSAVSAAEPDSLPLLGGKPAPQTFEAMWAGFDPRAEPLDVEVLRQWEEEGVVMKVLRYRVGVFKGKKAMMIGVYGHLKGAKQIPGLVQIHGGGQYADHKAVLTNAKRGYATISISWAGRISAPDYTVSPDVVKLFWDGKVDDPAYKLTTDWGALDGYHAPSRFGKDAFVTLPVESWTIDAVPSPRNSSWFLAAMGARRALTFLERQQEVDGDRLGVYGHSMGGKLTVMTAAADDRVKAAAPSCGGISDYRGKDPLQRNTVGDTVNLERVRCPIIFLSPSNDFHGRIDDLPAAIASIQTDHWRVTCAPHANHQDLPEYEVATQLWFDQFLRASFAWPKTPETKLTLKTDSGVPRFQVKVDPSKPVVGVDVFYTQQGVEGGDPKLHLNRIHRFWHHAPAQELGDSWQADLPVFDASKPLWVYANVTYALDTPVSGAGYYYRPYTTDRFVLSSLIELVKPGALHAAGVRAALKPERLIEDFGDDWEKEWFTYRAEDWGRKTHKVYHPRWTAPEGAALEFDAKAAEANTLVVGLDGHAAEVKLTGGTEWQAVRLLPADFRNAEGQGRPDWKGLMELRLQATDRLTPAEKGGQAKVLGGAWKGAAPEFRNLRWDAREEGEAAGASNQEEASRSAANTALPLSPRDYSFGYWKHGMRKHEDDPSKDILAIETGYYGLELDMADLPNARFGRFSDGLDYAQALGTEGSRMAALRPAKLEIQLEKDGEVFSAVTCGAGLAKGFRQLADTRLWESARFVQHFEIQKLEFRSLSGKSLLADGDLSVVGWPDSLTFTTELSPAVAFSDGPELGVQGKGHCVVKQPLVIPHQPGMENEQFTVETWIKIPEEHFDHPWGWLLCKNRNEATQGNYGFMFSRGRVTAIMNIGGAGRENHVQLRSSGQLVKPDQWHHLAMTYDGKTCSYYIDGRPQGTAELGKKRVPGNGTLSLGKRGDGLGKVTAAVFDQIRVWNRPLSPQKLIQHTRNPAVVPDRNGLTYENAFETDAPVDRQVWKNASLGLRFSSGDHRWQVAHKGPTEWQVGDRQKLTLNCPLDRTVDPAVKISVAMKGNTLPPVVHDPEFHCHVARIDRPKRSFPIGYRDIRDYDEIEIRVSAGREQTVPLLVEMINPANITGLCPILCEEDGTPTGIPVQLSKNWHYPPMGAYLRASMLLPASKQEKRYKLRIVYGFYGSLPSASHAQLSLVGYAGNGRWDQLAIGCWGETYCMDMDLSCVDIAVTDVRMLMARNGKDGKKWNWTDAGWGGDWLGLKDDKGRKHYFNGLRTAYLAHGPCLSEVRYDGFYGAGREVDLAATVRTLRTDDHARTFTQLRYEFDKPVSADGWLFKMGRTGNYVTPKVAYGNAAGLIQEHEVPAGLKEGEDFLAPFALSGVGPWWVTFASARHADGKDWGTGYRAMVIRSYKAVIGGKEFTQPVISFPAFRSASEGEPNVDFLLKAPVGVGMFQPGDSIDLDVEWITLPPVADDYYGPNEAFRKHLTMHPESWKTTHREAIGNDLKVTVEGGSLRHRYPVIVGAESEEVKVDLVGGVGFVPIRFEGLSRAGAYELVELAGGKEVKFDQSVHGQDFWQTDLDVASGRFWMTFNLPVDGKPSSTWVLRGVESRNVEAAGPGSRTDEADQPAR